MRSIEGEPTAHHVRFHAWPSDADKVRYYLSERAQDAMKEAVAAIETAVKRNPVQALGVALGIGFLVGIILRR